VRNGRVVYTCSENHPYQIPPTYAENEKIPRNIISAVGFRGHGKTSYFTALFLSLDNLAQTWTNFSTFAVNERSDNIVRGNIAIFNSGESLPPTPQVFPEPAIILFEKMPKFKDRFLIFYDTGGENFERSNQLVANAHFVTRSKTVIIFISLSDINYNPQEMHRLLSIYIQGLKELGGNPRDQHLLVVLTKGDSLEPKLHAHPEIWNYLITRDVRNTQYSEINSQINEMKRISSLLKTFLRQDIGAANFVNLAENNFRSLEISIVSAYNYSPEGSNLKERPTPKRIFDPLLWVMNNTTGFQEALYDIRKTTLTRVKTTRNQNSDKASGSPQKQSRTWKTATLIAAVCVILFISIYFAFFSGFQMPNKINLPISLGSPPNSTGDNSQAMYTTSTTVNPFEPSPTDVIPDDKQTWVTITRDPPSKTITVSLTAAQSLWMVAIMEVKVTTPSGKTYSKEVSILGHTNSIVINDFEDRDRVEVYLTFTDGTRYKVKDEIVPIRKYYTGSNST
jgi:hypothetical protein